MLKSHHFLGLKICLMWQTPQLPYSLSDWGWGNCRTMPSAPCSASGHASPVLPSFSFALCLLGSVARRPWCRGPPSPPWETFNCYCWFLLNRRAVDPHSFYADPDPAVYLNVDLDPDPGPAELNLKRKIIFSSCKNIKYCSKLRTNGACENLLLKNM